MKNYVIVAVLLLIFGSSMKAEAQAKWYSLADNEEYAADFVIPPNDIKGLVIKSDVKESIMFRVDAAGEDMKTLMSGPFPIEMTDTGSQKSIASFYGGREVVPINGEIRLEFSNSGEKEYRVLVVKTRPAVTVSPQVVHER